MLTDSKEKEVTHERPHDFGRIKSNDCGEIIEISVFKMSLQKFIDNLPASILKYQGFAIGRHTRALRDPELRKHPLLILGYQSQRKALKFQPVVFSLQKFLQSFQVLRIESPGRVGSTAIISISTPCVKY